MTIGTHSPPSSKGGDMGWVGAGLVMFGFAAPSAVVGVAYSIGSTGLVFGPIACVLTTLASVLGAMFLHSMTLQHKENNMPALGLKIRGNTGYVIGLFVQQGNFLLYLPVALLCVANALQGCIDPDGSMLDCDDYWIFVVAIFCFATTQLRDLNNVNALSYVSLACVVAVIFSALQVVSSVPNEDKSGNSLVREASWFGNPDMSSDDDEDKKKAWVVFMLGLSMCAWAYVPSFLTVELANPKVMENPEDFPKAILLSAALNVVVYLSVGLYVVVQWGWTVEDPIMFGVAENSYLWPSDDLRSKLLNFFWLVACVISYALDSIPLGRQFQRHWAPEFDVDDFSPLACVKYMFYTSPTIILGVAMAVFIPSLFCMLAVATALTVPFANMIFPAWLYKFEARNVIEKEKKDSSQALLEDDGEGEGGEVLRLSIKYRRQLPYEWAVPFVAAMGWLVFVVCAWGAFGKLAISDLRGPLVVGCGSWEFLNE
ncbi:hypothetical protein TrLO_g3769 [Triparma laevis f. longispina]|uniref:Amino acid transporter transmembrane domain-containing protein n=1 Tax=Triparma laevis f. longispina TaxID=1714387 RepID=A0A9W7FRG9_9STRA|nr:hypothetical protein TrLO_g3769 [Triparma laevis f. longispina]